MTRFGRAHRAPHARPELIQQADVVQPTRYDDLDDAIDCEAAIDAGDTAIAGARTLLNQAPDDGD